MDMSLKYKLLKRNAFALSLALSIIPLIISLSLFLVWLFSDIENIDETMLLRFTTLPFLLMAIVFVLAYIYIKESELIIDIKGVRTSNKLLSLFSSFKSIEFDTDTKFFKIDDFVKTINSNRAKELGLDLQENDSVIAVINHKNNKRLLISDNAWTINDLSEIETWLNNHGFCVESTNTQEFINEYIPQLGDLGKKAGFFAYASIVAIVLCIIISAFDGWSTIDYGNFRDTLWIIFAVLFSISFIIMYQNKTQAVLHALVAGLFSICAVILVLVTAVTVIPFVGMKSNMDFTYVETNKHKEEKWTSEKNPKLNFLCKQSKAEKLKQHAEIAKFFGLVRVNPKTLCKDSKFLSNAEL